MPLAPRPRLVNPRLGAYFGIFAGSITAAFLLLLILEQLGASPDTLLWTFVLLPIAAYAGIGALAYCKEPADFFASGRRVPSVYAGLTLALSACGAVGIVVTTGVFYAIGFDAISLVVGGIAGLVAMALLLAPFLRKHGAYTVPGFLGQRLRSRTVRVLAAALLSVPVLLVLIAELRIGAWALGAMTGQPAGPLAALLALTVVAILAPGGMRSLTWSNAAQGILLLMALSVVVAIVGVAETNLPVPQLSQGPVLRGLGRNEVMQGVPIALTAPISLELPEAALVRAPGRFASPFAHIGPLAFSLLSLVMMAGLAAAPWLLPRVSTTTSVYDTRKSIGWATFFFGLIMITVATIAMFMREAVMDIVVAGRPLRLPPWLTSLADLGLAKAPAAGERLSVAAFAIHRDAVLLAFPLAGEMPAAFLHLVLAAAVAASLLAATTAAMALAAILTEDVVGGVSWEPFAPGMRLSIGRIAVAGSVLLALAIGLVAAGDPLTMFLWAVTLSAATAFPVLVLAVWWKLLSAWGAALGMIAGFATTVLAILASQARWLPVDGALAGALGLPIAFAVAIAVSLLMPAPDRRLLETARDIRMPGGETLYDKEMRLLRLKQRQRG